MRKRRQLDGRHDQLRHPSDGALEAILSACGLVIPKIPHPLPGYIETATAGQTNQTRQSQPSKVTWVAPNRCTKIVSQSRGANERFLGSRKR